MSTGDGRRFRVVGGSGDEPETTRIGDVVVTVDRRGAHPVVHATIDRPAARNALGVPVLDGLAGAVDTAADVRASVLVVRGSADVGSGAGTLSAGADLHHLRGLDGDAAGVGAFVAAIGATLVRIEAAPCVTVAVVGPGGYAVAGGCELLLACDLAVVAADANIGDGHLEYGLLPGAGGSVRLNRRLPGALARRLLYTGELVDGATAHAWGLASHVAAPGELDATVDGLVTRLARHGGDALRAMKQLVRAAAPPVDSVALAAERAAAVLHLTTSADAREGLDAFVDREES